MNLAELTRFFMWCTLIDGGLLLLWTGALLLCPDLVYRIQRRWFPLSRETFNVVMYAFLGGFKIVFLVFNFTPWIALLLMGSGTP
ncbi:MAG TPA: hypothetical protein PLA80_05490 [Synergistaceae bacterium]|nr:hypothetical protein [Synergistaceae bacterium]